MGTRARSRWTRLWSGIGDELAFWRAKLGEVARRRIDPSLTDHPALLDDLRRDGIILVEDVLDADQLRIMIAEIESLSDLMTARRDPAIVERNARYLLLDPACRMPSTRAFFEHPLVTGLVRAYLSAQAMLDRPAVQLKIDVGAPCIVDFFHIDEWRHLVSGFLFLSDVGEAQAPMIYLRGSHRPSRWRLAKEREFFHYYECHADGAYANDESAYCGCFLPPEARRIADRHGYAPLLCTGRAGTLMLFDNRGLHRATPLLRDHRLLLSGYWMLPPRQRRRRVRARDLAPLASESPG
jgi:hypothetical protein